MKAWVLHRINDIRYEEVDTPEVSNTGAIGGEVLVKVRAAGICGSDIPRIYETGAHRMPLIPGHEFAGEVAAVGEGVDTGWIGKRVGVYPLIPCRKCHSCLQDQYELCRNYDYIGSRRDGAFAEYVRVPMDNLIEIPDAVTYEAAAMLEPMAVAVHAMRIGLRGLIESNKDIPIAVCGLGTIGLCVVAFLLDAGFNNLYLIGNKDKQIKMAVSLLEEYKADVHICDIRSQDPISCLNDKCLGFDVCFDCVGSVESLDYGLKGLLPAGRMITVGNPHGDMNLPRDSYWQILRKQLTLLGTWNSSFFPGRYHDSDDVEMDNWIAPREKLDDWHYVLDRLAKGCVRPEKLITHRLNMDELDKGLIMMRDKMEEYIKVMVTNVG